MAAVSAGKDEEMRKCIICGTEFKPQRKSQITCGALPCQKARMKQVLAEHRRENGIKPVSSERVCEICGKVFVSNAPNQKVCSSECQRVRKRYAAKEWYADHKNANVTQPQGKTFKKFCLICKKEYEANSSNQKYCGKECAAIAMREQAKINKPRNQKAMRERKKAEKRAAKIQGSHDSLVNAAVEARSAGMTYGQYMAQRYLQENRRGGAYGGRVQRGN